MRFFCADWRSITFVILVIVKLFFMCYLNLIDVEIVEFATMFKKMITVELLIQYTFNTTTTIIVRSIVLPSLLTKTDFDFFGWRSDCLLFVFNCIGNSSYILFSLFIRQDILVFCFSVNVSYIQIDKHFTVVFFGLRRLCVNTLLSSFFATLCLATHR